MVSRSEIDMKRIKDEYKKNYGKTLSQEILVSKHLTSDNDNKHTLEVHKMYNYLSFPFRMTQKETMRRFYSLSVAVKTKIQYIQLKIQQQIPLWKITYNLSTDVVPYALVEN